MTLSVPVRPWRIAPRAARLAWLAAALLPLLAAGTSWAAPAQARPTAPIPGQTFAWWRSDAFQRELALTSDQTARLARLWETTRPELRQEWDTLSQLEARLAQLIKDDADETVLTRQIDRVETARASANKTRSVMLVQMLKVLTPEQRARFTVLHERWVQTHPPRRDADTNRPSKP